MIWRSYLIGPCRNRSATSRDGPQRRRTATIAYVRPARPTAGAHMTQYALPEPSQRARDRYNRMLTFMREDVLPAEPEYLAARSAAGPSGHEVSPVIERPTPETWTSSTCRVATPPTSPRASSATVTVTST